MSMEYISHWQSFVDEHLQQAEKPLIVILGPTASGKTKFSLDVAKHIGNAEVINADSRQLYRHLNIGTAKITEEEKTLHQNAAAFGAGQRGVVHHLIDVIEPNEELTIASYKKMATEIIDDCHARNVVPLLVGGSMLYISAVVDGLDPLPVAPPELRKKLEAEYDADDGWALYDKLFEIDPATAKNFAAQNKHYVVRAMELYEITGRKPSELKKTIPPPYQILQLGLMWPRDEITKRIDERTKIMLKSGWIEEVEGLLDKGFMTQDPAMKSHGYKEIMHWLSTDDRNVEELEKIISAKTRQYAKRQMTWWGDDERIRWVDAKQL